MTLDEFRRECRGYEGVCSALILFGWTPCESLRGLEKDAVYLWFYDSFIKISHHGKNIGDGTVDMEKIFNDPSAIR